MLDVKDLDVEVEVVTAGARRLLVVVLLDVCFRHTASCSPFSEAVVGEELSKLTSELLLYSKSLFLGVVVIVLHTQ